MILSEDVTRLRTRAERRKEPTQPLRGDEKSIQSFGGVNVDDNNYVAIVSNNMSRAAHRLSQFPREGEICDELAKIRAEAKEEHRPAVRN